MINFIFEFNNKLKKGVLNDTVENLLYNVPTGSKFWNLDIIPYEEINEENYNGIGVSDFLLKIETDIEKGAV